MLNSVVTTAYVIQKPIMWSAIQRYHSGFFKTSGYTSGIINTELRKVLAYNNRPTSSPRKKTHASISSLSAVQTCQSCNYSFLRNLQIINAKKSKSHDHLFKSQLHLVPVHDISMFYLLQLL